MITEETYNFVRNRDGYICVNCGSPVAVELHHRISNSKANRSKYPNLIDHPDNLISLCGGLSANCHVYAKHKYKITDLEAERLEANLKGK